MKNNVFAQSSVLGDLKKKLAKEQEEVRHRNKNNHKYDPNHPDQRYHDAIERDCSERNGSGFYRGGCFDKEKE